MARPLPAGPFNSTYIDLMACTPVKERNAFKCFVVNTPDKFTPIHRDVKAHPCVRIDKEILA